ncbi:MAG TPA: PEGA domain-containing protein [Byssovorax sp.]
MDSLRYGDALAAYGQAYSISKDPALLYNQGRANQALGDFPAALESLARFESEAPAGLKARVPKLDELLADVRAHVVTLSITCNVAGARVLVRERVMGSTPLAAPLKVNAGRAFIEVDAEGYAPYRREVDVPGAQILNVTVTLASRATSGVLYVRSTAASGVVFIDGEAVGNAPVEAVVPAGEHKVAVRREGYEDTETTVVVGVGERKDVTVEAQKQPGILTKWWFWAGVGVVVTSGAVITYALLTEKKAGSGDQFSPGQVSGPLLKF